MIILKTIPKENGAYLNQTWDSDTMPDGYVVVPDEFMSVWEQYKPFVSITVDNGVIVSMSNNSEALAAATPVESIRASKVAEISTATEQAIISGINVETSFGLEHFRLDNHDQINISNLSILLATGVAGYLYHADGKACVLYPAADLQKLVKAALEWVTYHTTYNNFMKVWISRETDTAIINSITYGVTLPEDLAADMASLLAAVSGGMS